MDTSNLQIQIIQDGKGSSMTLSELKTALGLVNAQPDTPVVDTKPPVTTVPDVPVVVDDKPPYTNLEQMGTRGKDAMYTSTEVPYLQVYSLNPFKFTPRGSNVEFVLFPGKKKPVGQTSDWYGNAIPAGYVPLRNFRLNYFDAKKEQPFYEPIPDIKLGPDYGLR